MRRTYGAQNFLFSFSTNELPPEGQCVLFSFSSLWSVLSPHHCRLQPVVGVFTAPLPVQPVVGVVTVPPPVSFLFIGIYKQCSMQYSMMSAGGQRYHHRRVQPVAGVITVPPPVSFLFIGINKRRSIPHHCRLLYMLHIMCNEAVWRVQ
jgi:hypothetical protein